MRMDFLPADRKLADFEPGPERDRNGGAEQT
jgi:hypothetical protein